MNADNTKKATIRIEKLIFGGQGIGLMETGKKCLVWNALPGEEVVINITKNKSNFIEGVAEKIIKPSPDRQIPKEDYFLSTSPWQIMNLTQENIAKQLILTDLFSKFYSADSPIELISTEPEYGYRNKMEYCFWGDDNGISLAHYKRGTHGKIPVKESALASSKINLAGKSLINKLNEFGVRASDLKSVIFRSDKFGNVAMSLFVKKLDFIELNEVDNINGYEIWYSNPKSPASIRTKILSRYKSVNLQDNLLGQNFQYDVNCFFQVNLPVYELALEEIKKHTDNENILDMYCGVGSIGLSLQAKKIMMIESDLQSSKWAKINAKLCSSNTQVINLPSEQALEHIDATKFLVVDPPRSGLHKNLITRIIESKPSTIAYLSCNPSTQARDIASLSSLYRISRMIGYNFFPKTPHIESLVILSLR